MTSNCYPTDGARFARRLIATARLNRYSELLRTANRVPDYGVPRWARVQPPHPPVCGTESQAGVEEAKLDGKTNRELLHR